MKLRLYVPTLGLALLSLVSLPARAQLGLYFNPIVSRVSNSTPDTGPFAFLGQNGTSQIFGGVAFGGYYSFLHQPGFDVGVDAREEIQHGNSAALSSFLVGPRVAFHPIALGFKPYAQLSVGSGRTTSPLSPAATTKLEYDIFGGIDRRINRHLDFRVLEIGYGSVTTVSSAIHNGGTSIPAARLLNFSTGFVIHVP